MSAAGYSFAETGMRFWQDVLQKAAPEGEEKFVPYTDWDFSGMTDEVMETYVDWLRHDIENSPMPRVFLSQEGFSDLVLMYDSFGITFVERVLARLKSYYPVHVIMLARPQTSFIESMLAHSIKRGYSGGVEAFLESFPVNSLSWETHRDIFSMVSTNGDVRLLPFSMEILHRTLGKNLVESFFWRCGWDVQIPDDKVPQANPNASPDLHDLMNYANRTLPFLRATEVNHFLSEQFPKEPGVKINNLPREYTEQLIELYENENESLLVKYEDWCPPNALLMMNT